MPSVQNNVYVKEPYFEVAYFDSLQDGSSLSIQALGFPSSMTVPTPPLPRIIVNLMAPGFWGPNPGLLLSSCATLGR